MRKPSPSAYLTIFCHTEIWIFKKVLKLTVKVKSNIFKTKLCDTICTMW